MMKVKSAELAYIFDLDGTIVDSLDLHGEAFVYATERMGLNGKGFLKKFYELSGHRPDEILKRVFPELEKEVIARIVDMEKEYVIREAHRVKLVQEIVHFIKLIHPFVRMGLVTGAWREFAERVLEEYGLKRYFEVLVCREDVEKGKPDPEGIIKAMKALNAKRGVFVGDTENDRKAAERAGVLFVDSKTLRRVLNARADKIF